MEPAAAAKPNTYEDLLALGEEVRAELLGGQIVWDLAPMPEHGFVQAALLGVLGAPRGPGAPGEGGDAPQWWILPEVDVRLSEVDVVRPDLAGWRRDRLPVPWGRRPVEVVPDWICELISPSTALRDRREKRRLYGRHGVRHYWVVDPAVRTLEAWALRRRGPGDGEPAWKELGLWGAGETVRVPPFEGIAIDLGMLFPSQEVEPGGSQRGG